MGKTAIFEKWIEFVKGDEEITHWRQTCLHSG